MLRVIREVQPSWVVGENVLGLVNWSGGLVFHEVQADLEAEGYEVFPFVLPACAVNAPHRRDRVWFIAHANRIRHEYGIGKQSETDSQWREGSGNTVERKSKAIANTNGNGLNGSNGQHEEQPSEGGKYALCDFEQMGGDVADTNGIGQVKGCEQYEPNQQGYNIGSNTKGIIANTLCNGIGESWEGRQSEQFDTNGIERRITADTNDERLEGECRSIGELEGGFGFTGANTRNMQRPSWDNFPTQPPIRSGDDGLSARLDSITFPKWRNESIKAAGNAIVPQIALMIFKAIQESIGK